MWLAAGEQEEAEEKEEDWTHEVGIVDQVLGGGEGVEDCKGFGLDVAEVYALICG